MSIIHDKSCLVKNFSDGVFSPGGEDKALLGSNLSAPPGPSGANTSTDVFPVTPDGKNAKNPTNSLSQPSPASDKLVDAVSDSLPLPVGLLDPILINCHTFSVQDVKEKFLLHKYKLSRAPGVFLHLKRLADGVEYLYHARATAKSRYFPEGRAVIQEQLRERLGKERGTGVFLSLTVGASDYELAEAWSMMWKRFCLFRKALNTYRKRHMNATGSLVYLAVLEQCKSGFPHMHVFFPGLKWLIKESDLHKLDEWWGMGSATTEKEKRVESAQSYVLKYVSKLEGWSDMSMAFLWYFHLRLYNLSHCVYLAPKKPEWKVIDRYVNLEEVGKGLHITVSAAESLVDSGRFIELSSKEVRGDV